MKAIMYHYVRPEPENLPFFRYLHAEDFSQQLDWLASEYGFVSQAEFEHCLKTGEPCKGAVLTFDDGLKDHYDHVFPALKERGLWGLFYVTTGIYETGKLLDVHRIHFLLGQLGGKACMEMLHEVLTPDMLNEKDVATFHDKTYKSQDNDTATHAFKHCLNYQIKLGHREAILDEMLLRVLTGRAEADLCFEYYLSPEEMVEMSQGGMVFGSHTVTHTVMSKLAAAQQEIEISRSQRDLSRMVQAPVESFAYPYGGFHSFTDETEAILTRNGMKFSWNVEPRDIEPQDLQTRPQALPRYDCNMFPFGKASLGQERVSQT